MPKACLNYSLLTLNLVLSIFWASASFAAGGPKSENACFRYLALPAQFEGVFSEYTDTRYLQVPEAVDFSEKGREDGTKIQTILVDFNRRGTFIDNVEISTDVHYDPSTKTASLDALKIPSSISEEYGLKLLLAHYFDRVPDVKFIYLSIHEFEDVSHRILREQLARGKSLKAALRKTPLVRAIRAFGFNEFTTNTKIREPVGPGDYSSSEFGVAVELKRSGDLNRFRRFRLGGITVF